MADRIARTFGTEGDPRMKSWHGLATRFAAAADARILDIHIKQELWSCPNTMIPCLKAYVSYVNESGQEKKRVFLSYTSGENEWDTLHDTHPEDLWVRYEVDYKGRERYPTFEHAYLRKGKDLQKVTVTGEVIKYNLIDAQALYKYKKEEEYRSRNNIYIPPFNNNEESDWNESLLARAETFGLDLEYDTDFILENPELVEEINR